MRLAAALAGLATIPAMAALARRMLNNDRAVVAVALATALAPLLLRYSQEARSVIQLMVRFINQRLCLRKRRRTGSEISSP